LLKSGGLQKGKKTNEGLKGTDERGSETYSCVIWQYKEDNLRKFYILMSMCVNIPLAASRSRARCGALSRKAGIETAEEKEGEGKQVGSRHSKSWGFTQGEQKITRPAQKERRSDPGIVWKRLWKNGRTVSRKKP